MAAIKSSGRLVRIVLHLQICDLRETMSRSKDPVRWQQYPATAMVLEIFYWHLKWNDDVVQWYGTSKNKLTNEMAVKTFSINLKATKNKDISRINQLLFFTGGLWKPTTDIIPPHGNVGKLVAAGILYEVVVLLFPATIIAIHRYTKIQKHIAGSNRKGLWFIELVASVTPYPYFTTRNYCWPGWRILLPIVPFGRLVPTSVHYCTANGPLTRYVMLRVAHASGIPGTVFPPTGFRGNR